LFLVLVFVAFLEVYGKTNQQTVVSKCIDTMAIYGSLCLDISSKECFELTGTISISGQMIYGPTSVPIADIISRIQNNQQNNPNEGNLMCFKLTESQLYGTCSLCATVDQLTINGNSIHYCGTGLFNCSSSIAPLSQEFDIPCFDLENCGLFNCRNECNQKGRCSSFGLCECDPGYYGYDCSLQIAGNCVSSPLLDPTCWEISYPECNTVNLKLSSTADTYITHYSVNDFTSFDISPCKTVINEADLQCDMCLSMENIHTESSLVGCPTINLKCNDIPARSERVDCISIGPSYDAQTMCPTDDQSSKEPSPSSTPNQIVYILGLMLAILILLSVGFLIIRKFGDWGRVQPEVYVEDEEPLNESDY